TPSHGYGSETVVARQPGAARERAGVRAIARRNLVAAGSGALLVAVLGTVVTLGMTSDEGAGGNPSSNVGGNPTATQDLDDGTLGAVPKRDEPAPAGVTTTRPAGPGPDGTPGTSDDPSPSATTGSPSADPTGTPGTGGETSPEPTHGGGSTGPTGRPTKTGKPSTPPSNTDVPTTPGEPTDTGEPSTPEDPTTPPTTSTSAGGPADGATASAPASSAATETTESASTEPPVI
ncbi:ATP-binding protein, partial [Streptomyces sp. SID1328]|nr:ATP-binding protein [Streptomyces sp. SID1328]